MSEGPDPSSPNGNLARYTRRSDGAQAMEIIDEEGVSLAYCLLSREDAITLATAILNDTGAFSS